MPHAGEDEETHGHPDGAEDKRLAAAKVLHVVQADEGYAEIDAVQDHLRDEGVVDSGCLEDDRAVVEAADC